MVSLPYPTPFMLTSCVHQRSYELMARFVHPHFQRGANTLRQLSYDIAAGNRGTYSVQSQAAVETEIKKYADAQSKRAAE